MSSHRFDRVAEEVRRARAKDAASNPGREVEVDRNRVAPAMPPSVPTHQRQCQSTWWSTRCARPAGHEDSHRYDWEAKELASEDRGEALRLNTTLLIEQTRLLTAMLDEQTRFLAGLRLDDQPVAEQRRREEIVRRALTLLRGAEGER